MTRLNSHECRSNIATCFLCLVSVMSQPRGRPVLPIFFGFTTKQPALLQTHNYCLFTGLIKPLQNLQRYSLPLWLWVKLAISFSFLQASYPIPLWPLSLFLLLFSFKLALLLFCSLAQFPFSPSLPLYAALALCECHSRSFRVLCISAFHTDPSTQLQRSRSNSNRPKYMIQNLMLVHAPASEQIGASYVEFVTC